MRGRFCDRYFRYLYGFHYETNEFKITFGEITPNLTIESVYLNGSYLWVVRLPTEISIERVYQNESNIDLLISRKKTELTVSS